MYESAEVGAGFGIEPRISAFSVDGSNRVKCNLLSVDWIYCASLQTSYYLGQNFNFDFDKYETKTNVFTTFSGPDYDPLKIPFFFSNMNKRWHINKTHELNCFFFLLVNWSQSKINRNRLCREFTYFRLFFFFLSPELPIVRSLRLRHPHSHYILIIFIMFSLHFTVIFSTLTRVRTHTCVR